jgi:hypothetical protein
MAKTVAILQSNYIPWKGYFDIIEMSDEFILLDEVQYTRRDWRNRNRIKTPDGPRWLTIPVQVKGKYDQLIQEVEVADPSWRRKHWASLRQNYQRTPHFDRYAEQLQRLYLQEEEENLSRINESFLRAICRWLGIRTRIRFSSQLDSEASDKSLRLLELCRLCGAEVYLSGPAARDYLDTEAFDHAGIDVQWMSYAGYPRYDQVYPPFEHAVTVLDLLFHLGPAAQDYMLSFSRKAGRL